MPDTLIVSLDVGSSSVRTLAFDERGAPVAGLGKQLTYRPFTTSDGGFEIDAEELASLSTACLDAIHEQVRERQEPVAAIAISAFWHCFLGVDASGAPATPLIHLFDTRSAHQAARLSEMLDPVAAHQRTGCVFHTSYWPAKLLWLSENLPDAFQRTVQWMSFGEYLFLKLFGRSRTSMSMASASGIWNQNENRYDTETLAVLPIDEQTLAPPAEFDQPESKLLPPFATRWTAFEGIPWFPALGDGACNNIGSGCVSRDRFALMVGTSGAMRAIVEVPRIEIPKGLWCYRVDPSRFVLGGALSNGGQVFAWMRQTLSLPSDELEIERELSDFYLGGGEPGAHGLRVLPFFAGERSPYWRADFRAAITGMSMATTPMEILRASLESVALGFRQIYQLLESGVGRPGQVIGSGEALLHSPALTQMMADALGQPVISCLDPQSSARGAALLALERLGKVSNLDDVPPETGATFEPDAHRHRCYEEMLVARQQLIGKLFDIDG